jgi:hypothetical protein
MLTRLGVDPPMGLSPCHRPCAHPGSRSADAVSGSVDVMSGSARRGATRQTKLRGRPMTCAPLHTFRERSRPHAWAKRCVAGTTYNAVPLHTSRQFTRSEIDRRPTHGRSPVWRPGPTTLYRSTRHESDDEPPHGRSPVWRADPRRSYERSLARRTLRVAARLGWSFLITP